MSVPAAAPTSSVSERVRPAESRNILPCVSIAIRLPSVWTCVDSCTTSAENGMPAIERRLIPPDRVLVEVLLPLAWGHKNEVQNRSRHAAKIQRLFILSPGNLRHSTLHVTR